MKTSGVTRRSCVHVDAGSTPLRIGEPIAPVVKQYNLVAAKAGGGGKKAHQAAHWLRVLAAAASADALWRNRRSAPSDDRPSSGRHYTSN